MDSLWLDEAITFHRASLSASKLIADSQAHHHNPAYFMLMGAWLKVGDDEFMMRVPSAVFGALTIPVAYLLGRVAGGRWVATAAAVALLLNPRLLAYAQEARMYALYVLGASIAMAGSIWLVAQPTAPLHPLLAPWSREKRRAAPRAVLAWLACSLGWVVALYCHATAVLLVVSCSVIAILRIIVVPADRGRFLAGWCVANLLALAAFAPWILRLGQQVQSFKEGFWAVFPTASRAATELGPTFFYGVSTWRGFNDGSLALAGTYALRHRGLVLASLWLLALLGPGLVLLASFWQPMFMHRQFLWAAVPFGVIVGAGLVALPFVAARLLSLSVALVVGGWLLHAEYYEPYNKEPWREVIAFLGKRARAGETVVAGSYGVRMLFEYHFARKTEPLRRVPYQTARALPKLSSTGVRRGVWVVTRSRHRRNVEDALTLHGWTKARAKAFGKGITATYYRPPRRLTRSPRTSAASELDDTHPRRDPQ